LSEVEIALVVLMNSFYRWVDHCASAAGVTDISSVDLLVLHFITHRKRAMTNAALAYALSIQETHVVAYATKKLERLGLLKRKRSGKEVLFMSTAVSEAQYAKYAQIRGTHLIRRFGDNKETALNVEALIDSLRALSGVYERATRSVASA
jgi:predicted MarR family transcription regulator